VLAVTDAMVLSSHVDGVLVVVQPGRSRLKAVLTMLEDLRRADARIFGVALKIAGKSRHARRYEGRIPLSSVLTRLSLMFMYFRRKPILPISMLNKIVLIFEWILILLLGNYGAT